MSLCGFYEPPSGDERDLLEIDPDLVLGCLKEIGDGPLFFFVPVKCGAVRVPVCQQHADYLDGLYNARERA